MKNIVASIILVSAVICHLSFVTVSVSAQTPPKPYNENQDIRADLKKATALAKKENKHVLIQFGGNWCPWCIRFHQMAHGAQPIDSLLKADYI